MVRSTPRVHSTWWSRIPIIKCRIGWASLPVLSNTCRAGRGIELAWEGGVPAGPAGVLWMDCGFWGRVSGTCRIARLGGTSQFKSTLYMVWRVGLVPIIKCRIGWASLPVLANTCRAGRGIELAWEGGSQPAQPVYSGWILVFWDVRRASDDVDEDSDRTTNDLIVYTRYRVYTVLSY